jgi:predicted metalloendopeptidase
LIIWLFVKDQVGFLPKVFQEAKQRFNRVTKNRFISFLSIVLIDRFYLIKIKVYEGNNIKKTRKTLCGSYVSSRMDYVVGRSYVEKYFDKKSKKSVIF